MATFGQPPPGSTCGPTRLEGVKIRKEGKGQGAGVKGTPYPPITYSFTWTWRGAASGGLYLVLILGFDLVADSTWTLLL
jgi:hypothetical protein